MPPAQIANFYRQVGVSAPNERGLDFAPFYGLLLELYPQSWNFSVPPSFSKGLCGGRGPCCGAATFAGFHDPARLQPVSLLRRTRCRAPSETCEVGVAQGQGARRLRGEGQGGWAKACAMGQPHRGAGPELNAAAARGHLPAPQDRPVTRGPANDAAAFRRRGSGFARRCADHSSSHWQSGRGKGRPAGRVAGAPRPARPA